MGPVSQHFHLLGSYGTEKNPHHCWKRVRDVDPVGVAITFPGPAGLSVWRDFNIGISFMILLQVL